jgi:hypothetical protein
MDARLDRRLLRRDLANDERIRDIVTKLGPTVLWNGKQLQRETVPVKGLTDADALRLVYLCPSKFVDGCVGVRARVRIPASTVICVYPGLLVSSKEWASLQKKHPGSTPRLSVRTTPPVPVPGCS